MRKELEGLIAKVADLLGSDRLYEKDTVKYVDDIAGISYPDNVRRLLKVAFESGFMQKFKGPDGYREARQSLQDYIFISDDVADDVVSAFAVVLGIGTPQEKPAACLANAEDIAVKAAAVSDADFVFVRGGGISVAGKYFEIDGFYMCRHTVTQGEWRNVMRCNPACFIGDDSMPIENVSWYNAIEYCNIRSILEGLSPVYSIDRTRMDPFNSNMTDHVKWTITLNTGSDGYRLPADAEWEYAARGGAESRHLRYAGGMIVDDVSWYDGNSGKTTHPVMQKKPNELGLYDMGGNVWEWCWDWYGKPSNVPEGHFRVIRGGSWQSFADYCVPLYRFYKSPAESNGNCGFRICRSGVR